MSLRQIALFLVCLFLLGQGFTLKADDGDVYAPFPTPTPYNNETDTYSRTIEMDFNVTRSQINDCSSQNVPEESIPVVFFIAQKANVDPNAVISSRLSGLNWMQVAWHLQVKPFSFFTLMNPNSQKLAPYFKAYNLYRGHDAKIRLTDDDVVNLVNLKMINDVYGCPPEEIAQMRAQGKSFRAINDRYANRDVADWDIPELNPAVPVATVHTPGTDDRPAAPGDSGGIR